MGTRSRIACRQPDGSILSIYCHWDGYPTGVGHTLVAKYSNLDTLGRLLARGDRSSLEDTPEEGMAYADRGDEDVSAVSYPTRADLSQSESGEEYMYLYEPEANQWLCLEMRAGGRGPGARWFKLHAGSHN